MSRRFLLALLPALALAACDEDSGIEPGVVLSSEQPILLLDECDPATFNAALGDGTCINRTSGITFDEFSATLATTARVPEWRIDPVDFTVFEQEGYLVLNGGGETHTYTRVAEFGGGIVPELNEASGNPVVAPECANLVASDFIAAGQSVAHRFIDPGNHNYQCCIHPWMRQIVHVRRQ